VCSEETRADPDCVFYDDAYEICVEMFRRELVTVDVFALSVCKWGRAASGGAFAPAPPRAHWSGPE
jgi:hypothetical protein